MALISLENISKAYAGIPALRGVDLSIAAGEIHALMGENGAGKSTLIKILAGVVAPDTATIRIDGRVVSIDSPAAARGHGLRFIHQELSVVPTLSVAENILLGRVYPRRAGFLVDWRKLNGMAREALQTLGITHIDPRTKLARLSLGDRMLVKISSAFLADAGAPARLYVMDEPTAALTRDESERLFKVLRGIKASGNSVLYVSHRIDEVMALCDRATVLRDGKPIDSGPLSGISHDDLVALMIGRKVGDAYPAPTTSPLSEIAFERPGLVVRKGEIVGIAGLAGAGQTELLRQIFGDPGKAWKHGLAYVPRERRSEGLVTSRPIYQNITLPHLQAQSLGGTWLKPRREREITDVHIKDLQIRPPKTDIALGNLSGGNQQKVALTKWLTYLPKVLILSEPTRGMDVGAKEDVIRIVKSLRDKGVAILVLSTEPETVLTLADRVTVLKRGTVAKEFTSGRLEKADLLDAA